MVILEPFEVHPYEYQKQQGDIWLLLVEPLNLERVIHKSKRAVDTLQAAIGSVEIKASIDTVHPPSIDTVHPTSIDTVHPTSIDTFHPTSIDTVHPTSIDTVQPVSENTVHYNTVHRDTVHFVTIHLHTIHPASIDTVHSRWTLFIPRRSTLVIPCR
ncbi:hypothetical protein DY000_02032361 [Brassica cretica]|uniref:Uncharacterized protein n=1 Tax=Brassica cretica TaxID=69181 RepID=A0ABQ7DNJ5_BRACR|nr:hypothetical protein DY000_02032361 [Brassica cretica]